MRKIELSSNIEQRHLKYFENNIVPNFDKYKIEFEEKEEKEEHEKFMSDCEKNKKTLAIGKPKELRSFSNEISEKIKEMIENDKHYKFKNKDKNKIFSAKYVEILQKIFGYDSFGTKDLSHYVKKEIINRYNNNKNKECKKYIIQMSKEAREVLLDLSPTLEVPDPLDSKELENIVKSKKVFVVTNNVHKLKSILSEWNPYAFIFMSNIRVCPYCNRQYITPIYSEKGKLRADLDHFYPKSKYPYLSMSIYNLVPSCKFCNSSLKGTREFDINDINPYEKSYDDYFKFSTDPLNECEIQVNENSDKISNYLEMFKIKELYNYHINQAKELVQKRVIYPDSYIEEIYKTNQEIFNSKKDIKQLIVGYIEDKSKINDEAFLKLRRDIAEQLHFINEKQDDKLIGELKEILKTGVK